MGVVRKIFKVIGRILLVLLILIVIAIIASFIYQKIAQKKDRELLERDGFSHLYDAGDYKMNINIYGEGENKIIVMPGNGHAEFTVDMKKFSEHLSDDISLVVVTRPGYGLCGETKHDVTTEYIVDSTRTALKNAGVEAPYILMPHSLSGIYGTYWENTYPDEVSGVIFLDSVNEAYPELTDEELKETTSGLMFGVTKFLYKSGVLRAINDITSKDSSDEYAKDANALFALNPPAFSKSHISEMKNFNSNMKTAWASIKSNDIPKIYISTNYQTIQDVRDYLMFMDGEVDEAKAQEWFGDEQSDREMEYRTNRSKYIEKVGNCKEVNISGSHFIYEQKPDEVAKVIKEFADSIK
ncbi:MAG: alpha/beta hydrolase [Ruminococcus sp.]|uniref:alpha/beta fold hydrolase n=1 Tax=Ruminococcus sp. TaxID=41978 RepID=UPI0025EC0FB9|nr:alpha/beta hydrolase [Ruminococcus sp.]MBR5683951.1 alpha/beta hydrolase [Ruminococcus sp.]